MTREADVFLIDGTESEQSAFADLISGSIGEGSVFHVGYGYYADGVEEKTAVLPPNWRSRALSTEIDAGLEIVSPRLEDLAVSKLMAWREKDIDWLRQIASFVESEAFAFSVSEIEPDSRNVFSSQEIDRRIVSAFGAFSAPISAKLRDLRNRRSNVAATVPRP
ncbi:MAG: nucleotidyltransferase [Azospirillum sp.]|nr:nucleotidyltransferase [Azospirillum sp.]